MPKSGSYNREVLVPLEKFFSKGWLPHIGTELLMRAASKAPVLSGRLQQGGVVSVEGRIWGTSNRGKGTPNEEPLGGPGEIVISFSAVKPVKAGSVFYTDSGGRWFDYASYVHDRHPWTSFITPEYVATLIDKYFPSES